MQELQLAWHALTSGLAIPATVFGVIWGTLACALPGISPSIAMALLLPFTYAMDPVPAIVMLSGVYVGAEYGGSIPAILIRTPGTNAAAATVIDGYEMNRQGRAGQALGISLISSLIGGLFGLVLLILLTEPLARVALAFTPPAYFALGVLGLSIIASLSEGSVLKGLIAGIVGFMIATIGTDPMSGVPRFTFGTADLLSGVRPILIMVGIYAVSEMLAQVGSPPWAKTDARETRLVLPNWLMTKRLVKPQAIGAVIGALEGCVPGGGGTVAAFLAYNEAKRWSKKPDEFGHGSPEGVAAPECANNVVTATTLVPLLSFGIPGSNSAAVLLGALLIHGLAPGPLLFERSAEVVYGLYGGLFVANIAMLLVGLVVLTPCIWLVNRPKPYLIAFILAVVFSGVYSIDQSVFDLGIVLAAGVLGYGLRYFGVSSLPVVLGVVLGYMVESNYRRSLVLSAGDPMVFLQNPISLGLLLVAAVLLAFSLVRERRAAMKAKA